MKTVMRLGGALLLSLLASCQIDPFHISGVEAPIDAAPDGCVTGGPEFCNGRDDNCDGLVDEGYALDLDPFNCGGCGIVCDLPNAMPLCQNGECTVNRCLPGTADHDGDPLTGCEAICTVTETATNTFCDGQDCCDAMDNDCDGEEGEDHDITEDPQNCGGCASSCTVYPCPHVCTAPFATMACVSGACAIQSCHENFHNIDGDRHNGCEYSCTPSGDEECNGRDDNCDGEIDEGCGDDCTDDDTRGCGASPNEGVCEQLCASGTWGDCTSTGDGVELCDSLDNDCNGRIDDDIPIIPSSCGDLVDYHGANACISGQDDVCVGYRPARSETCDGEDNDGDGENNEDVTCTEADSVCDVDLGRCLIPCLDVDVPLRCPMGMNCNPAGLCLGDLCPEEGCGECEQCDESIGACVSLCAGLSCPDGMVCYCGACWPPTCGVLGCPEGELCLGGQCVDDPCTSAGCDASQGCVDGTCFEPCMHGMCGTYEICVRGDCIDDECVALSCGVGECNQEVGECSEVCADVACPPGLACDLTSGRCIDDPCEGVHCPEGTTCERVPGLAVSSCVEDDPVLPDAGPEPDADGPDADPGQWVLATGGGGCKCNAGSLSAARPALMIGLIAGLVWMLWRRRP